MNAKALELVDFLTFTAFGYENDWRTVVRNFLRIEPDLFTPLFYGGNGYALSAVYNDIRVYFGGREEYNEHGQTVYPMGVCVSMSGNGCRTFEDYCGKYQIIDLLEFLLPYADTKSVNITRLDIAADDKTGTVNLKKVLKYIREGKLNCRFDKVRAMDDITLRNPVKDAGTIYIGSAKSSFRFRIYDKAKEQGDYESHWIRVEMVCRDEYALGAARELVRMRDRVGECVAGMIRARLNFIELDHTRRTNCTAAKWWDKFLNYVAAIEFFYKEKPVRTADKLYGWIYDSLAASLATASEIFGDSFIKAVVADGRRRLSPFQQALIMDFRAKNGLLLT